MSIVTIPNSVTAIGDSAFYNCGSLINASIPDSVTSIADYTFAECKSLTNVTIPDGVIKIGERAFENCSSLNNVSIPISVDSILFHAFAGCNSLTSVAIPSGVTTIEHATFENCTSMTGVTIPSGVTKIGEDVFAGCSSLSDLKIPSSVTTIDNRAFKNCTSLINLTIPDSMVKIGKEAFSECSNLINIVIPTSSVCSIDKTAFVGCSNADVFIDFNSSTIPDLENNVFSNVHSVTLSEKSMRDFESGKIGNYTYVDLGLPSGLKWATYNLGTTSLMQYGVYFQWGVITPYSNAIDYTYPDTITAINDAASAHWGASWRMPTKQELQELVDGCDWQWMSNLFGSVVGKMGTSKTNGKRIFLPAAGHYATYKFDYAKEGDYWSSSKNDDGKYMLEVDSYREYWDTYGGHVGASIRAVSE